VQDTNDQEGRTVMGYLVRTITAMQLRLGDVVIPDIGPRRHVTQHRIQGAHPVVAVQYAEMPGATSYYPPTMPLLVEIPDVTTTTPVSRSL
jgi:hypothetical protein